VLSKLVTSTLSYRRLLQDADGIDVVEDSNHDDGDDKTSSRRSTDGHDKKK